MEGNEVASGENSRPGVGFDAGPRGGASEKMATPVISARNVSKAFSGRTVLREANLNVFPGEIHGLLGQNGSGKSTLIKILAGVYAPDEGASLEVLGRPVSLPLGPGDPQRLGMSFVHQDLGLASSMSVLENLRVGTFKTGIGWRIRWRSERNAVRASLARFGLADVSPDTAVGALRDVERAMIAIIRALERLQGFQHGLLVLDEPTSYLPRDGVDRLFAAVREAARAGTGTLFVTHRIEEVRAVTDRVTILRDGVVVETTETASLSEQDLIDRILGRTLGELYPSPHHPQGEMALEASNVSSRFVREFALGMRRGEIVGLTGLLGMGHEEVPYLLYGASQALSGTVKIGRRTFDLKQFAPRQAIDVGMALLPGNRLKQGAALSATVTENVTLPTLSSYYDAGLLRHRRERRRVRHLLDRFEVRPADPDLVFAKLSGGNQQKALLAKWFETEPQVMLLHEPTQGVDIGARKQVFEQIRDAAETGTAILIASAEYEDLAHLCDRVLVFRNGRPVVELQGADLTHERIVEQCFKNERQQVASAE